MTVLSAHALARREGVSPTEAREAIAAAIDVITWRGWRSPDPWRVMRLAAAILEQERRMRARAAANG
jgi:hypothetical protein